MKTFCGVFKTPVDRLGLGQLGRAEQITPSGLETMANPQNLRKRPRAPAKDRGRVQRGIRRAFAASGAEALCSTQIYDWTHVRRRLGRRKSMPFGVYSRTLRTLRMMCDPIERVPSKNASGRLCEALATL
jgi:hypothetical protein